MGVAQDIFKRRKARKARFSAGKTASDRGSAYTPEKQDTQEEKQGFLGWRMDFYMLFHPNTCKILMLRFCKQY